MFRNRWTVCSGLCNDILPGKGAYDLVCINSIQKNFEEAKRWLEVSYESGTLPTLEHLENDTDLDNLRDFQWFKEFLKMLE